MFRKSFNLFKIVSGYTISRITRKVIHWGNPVSLSIEPTNCCNLHCPECPSGTNQMTRERGTMNLRLFQNIVDELSPDLYYLNLYFQGEPYLHPWFTEMITYAKSKKIYVSTSTNGHFLTNENISKTLESGLDKLIISLDGTDVKTYQQYRIGGNFNEVLRGIAELVRQKKSNGSKNPKIILQFLVLKSNQHQVNEIRKLGKELAVDKVELKTAQFYDFRNGNLLIPERRYSRYIKNKNAGADQPSFKIRNGMPDHCFRMWSTSVVTWDGKVVPCCFDKDAAHLIGNLKDSTFLGIWRNGGYKDFRKKILSSRKSLDICTNCTEGSGITSIL